MYSQGGRQDLVDKETGIKQLIDNFLPQVMKMDSGVLHRGHERKECYSSTVNIACLTRHPSGVPASPRQNKTP